MNKTFKTLYFTYDSSKVDKFIETCTALYRCCVGNESGFSEEEIRETAIEYLNESDTEVEFTWLDEEKVKALINKKRSE